MSLTSYRAAPPRAKMNVSRQKPDRAKSAKDERRPSSRESRRCQIRKEDFALRRPGNDLLSQVLRHSTIGAEVFDGRVRDGIGPNHFARVTRPEKGRKQTG